MRKFPVITLKLLSNLTSVFASVILKELSFVDISRSLIITFIFETASFNSPVNFASKNRLPDLMLYEFFKSTGANAAKSPGKGSFSANIEISATESSLIFPSALRIESFTNKCVS